MNLIVILEILILFQKTLNQYATNQIYYHSLQYTQAAYYLPSQNEEYSWTKDYHIGTQKAHRKRKKYKNDNYFSAELDYGSKRLQCKCTCKRKYTTPIPEYEQSDPCCPCDSKPDAGSEYLPPQYPDAETDGINIPTQFTYPVVSGIYTPVTYPPMIYHTFDLVEIGKVFPWLTTKADINGQKDKDKSSTSDDKGKATTRDDKDTASTKDDRDDKDKSSKSEDKDKATTTTRDDTDDKDKSTKSDDKDKSTTREDKVRTTKEDDKSTTIDDRDKPGKDDKDETSTKEESAENTEKTTTNTTTEPTISTYPYVVNEDFEKLLHYSPKKKPCLRNNNYCVRKDTNRKIGRYYEDVLVERPTIASYLNGNRRRNNFLRKLNEDIPF
ncbi:uncharacterized protein [Maniola hyperantus]|uniref:uncharacterized protein n=1 Tax=Aphantopus hyperantus TaxID=2795564 RepID=UPI001568FD34|nr:uncharacterized protein LOC117988802 [Maniola hyperantus]